MHRLARVPSIRRFAVVLAVLALAPLVARDARATERLRVATYNVQSLETGGPGYTALVSVINRVGADVVLLQEITGATEATQVAALASATGYSYSGCGSISGTLSGDLRNAVMSRYPISTFTSWNAKTISGDLAANDICRDIVQAVIDVPNVCAPVAVFSLHLKAGSTSTDDFRRAVELLRVKKVVENWLAAHPDHHVVIGGDFNENVFDGPFGNTFNSLPSGLPGSYHLGNDVTFPVVYNPFVAIAGFGGIGLTYADTTQEDCTSCYATRPSSGRRLDYLFARSSDLVLGDEIYASPVDNGVDDGAPGNILRKTGSPLASGTSVAASDHFTVFADYLLESCDGSRYGIPYPGEFALSPRAGIAGTAAPGNPGFAARLVNARPSASVVCVLGRSVLLPGFPLAPYVPGASLYVNPADAYGFFPLATDTNGRAALPLPLYSSPTLIGIPFRVQWFVTDAAAQNGIGAMSDAYDVTVHA